MNLEKIKPWRSDRYLDWIRARPCANCHRPGPSDPHHVIGLAGGYMGGKAGDQFAVPLCRACHDNLHKGRLSLGYQTVWLVRTQEQAFHHGIIGGTHG